MKKIIIVVGSEGDIGKAIVKSLELDNKIVTNKIVNLDKKTGFDVCNKEHRQSIYNKYKRVDGIVMSHGVTNTNWNDTLDINLYCIYKFLNLMYTRMKEYGGSIVNITSLGSIQGFPNNPQYCVSKGGLRMLTKALAVDWGKYNIRVNNVCPGYIKTNMTRDSFNNINLKHKRDNRIILDRWGGPEDVANAVEFLLSDKSSYITGIDLIVDGGWMAKGL